MIGVVNQEKVIGCVSTVVRSYVFSHDTEGLLKIQHKGGNTLQDECFFVLPSKRSTY